MRRALGAVAQHPGLWFEAIRALVALSPEGWWRTPPFVPRIDPTYAAWRVATAYGSETAEVSGDDLIGYLEWRKQQRSLR